MIRYLFAVMTLLVLLPVFTPAQCLTTLPPNPQFVPPKPYPQDAPASAFWFGTESLWTSLPSDGVWGGGFHHNNDKEYLKLFFWAKGYDAQKESKPKLIITGRRLDGDSPSVAVANANNAFLGSKMPPAMVTGFEIPTAGCWELTAHYGGHTLTFIVSVKP
jgi:hypothetical protein